MNIGEASAATGVSAKMIRHYEQTGLIRPALRSGAGYRVYGDADVHDLRFIRRARDLGFSTAQMAQLMKLWRDRSRASSDVKAVALAHIGELEAKMQALQDMTRALRHLAEHCHGDARPHCPIIEDLSAAGATPADEGRKALGKGFEVLR
ncbi:MAG: Cu(I)-responsive transcriptional regulator [Rhizobiales bacterium]|nr:Cu(I)-responsive transcriptional regulator [Hyphomicrobiales bacterium]